MITGILPTYNRAAALPATLPVFLRLRGLTEIVVVDDGSTDDTAAVLARFADPRLRVVRHERNRGLPAARNTGAAAARTEWVVYLEDDCGFPDDYAETLLRVAGETGADIVSAPWLNVPEERYAAEVARRRAAPEPVFGLDTHPSTFPPGNVETPFMCALALVRRSVVLDVRYDEDVRGSAFREETDFYLRAVAAGHRAVCTPETASWQVARFPGGEHPPVLAARYEYRLLSRNWWFLRRHRDYLREHGGVPAVWRAQARFATSRATVVARRAGGRAKRALRR